MEKRIIELYRRKFDDIRHEEDGIEYWYARELMTLLDYVQWRNFENVVKKGMLSCKNNGIRSDFFCKILLFHKTKHICKSRKPLLGLF